VCYSDTVAISHGNVRQRYEITSFGYFTRFFLCLFPLRGENVLKPATKDVILLIERFMSTSFHIGIISGLLHILIVDIQFHPSVTCICVARVRD
jgi:hypothetical protein